MTVNIVCVKEVMESKHGMFDSLEPVEGPLRSPKGRTVYPYTWDDGKKLRKKKTGQRTDTL